MFRYFKTTCDFNYLTQSDIFKNNEWFKHLEGNNYGLRICPFGQTVVLIFIGMLIARSYYPMSKFYTLIMLIISFLLSLLNFNAVIYLIPIWLIEIYYLLY